MHSYILYYPGFGDVVPGSANLQTSEDQWKMIGAAIYMIFGMAILSMCFRLYKILFILIIFHSVFIMIVYNIYVDLIFFWISANSNIVQFLPYDICIIKIVKHFNLLYFVIGYLHLQFDSRGNRSQVCMDRKQNGSGFWSRI